MAKQVRIRRLIIFALAGWAGTIWTVLNTDPYPTGGGEAAQALFFLCLGMALFGTFSLGAFALSHVVFQSAAQRGDLAYSSEQGLLLTGLTISLLLMRINGGLQPLALLILLGVFATLQILLLFRTIRSRA